MSKAVLSERGEKKHAMAKRGGSEKKG